MNQLLPTISALGMTMVLYAVLVAGVATTAVAARTSHRRRAALSVLKLLLCRRR